MAGAGSHAARAILPSSHADPAWPNACDASEAVHPRECGRADGSDRTFLPICVLQAWSSPCQRSHQRGQETESFHRVLELLFPSTLMST